MFCPLCKAEYRQGPTTCSDCHIALVSSQPEAAAIAVTTAWEGHDRKQLIRILDAFTSAGIPFYSSESVERQPGPWISLLFSSLWLLSPFFKRRPLVHCGVRVLQIDLARAQNILRQIDQDGQTDAEA